MRTPAMCSASPRYPARTYAMVDDKLCIVAGMKQIWGDRLTAVFPRQGRYALYSQNAAGYTPTDITVERTGDLPDFAAFDNSRGQDIL